MSNFFLLFYFIFAILLYQLIFVRSLNLLITAAKNMKEDLSIAKTQESKEIPSLSPELDPPSSSEINKENKPLSKLEDEFVLNKVIFKGSQDSYQIQDKLGRGGYGDVYRVQPSKNKDVQYAMKVVGGESVIEMEKEILNKAKSLRSIHLPQIHDSGIHNLRYSRCFIVLDLLGPNLNEFRRQGYTLKIWMKICEQCLIAIETLHNLGYIHRDLKPDNFVLGRKGSDNEYAVILIDFGMAETIKEEKTNGCYQGTSGHGSISGREGKPQGPKDDLESWFYMLMESFHQLPWRKKGQEWNTLELKKAIRDEKTEICKEFFDNYDPKSLKKMDCDMDFAKTMRYIDSLKFDEVPDYDRIHYLLQCAYWNLCKASAKPNALKYRSLKLQEKEEYLAEFKHKQKEVAKFQRFSHGPVDQPQNITFFSSIVYDEKGKFVKNIDYCGISLNSSGEKTETKNHLRFKCDNCVDKKPCGLVVYVHYDGTERTWEEARIERIKGDPNNCQKLKKLRESYKLFVEGLKLTGERLENDKYFWQ